MAHLRLRFVNFEVAVVTVVRVQVCDFFVSRQFAETGVCACALPRCADLHGHESVRQVDKHAGVGTRAAEPRLRRARLDVHGFGVVDLPCAEDLFLESQRRSRRGRGNRRHRAGKKSASLHVVLRECLARRTVALAGRAVNGARAAGLSVLLDFHSMKNRITRSLLLAGCLSLAAAVAQAKPPTNVTVDSWVARYGAAWEARDAAAAGVLFTAKARYSETPFELPKQGRAAIEEYWRTVTADQRDIIFK